VFLSVGEKLTTSIDIVPKGFLAKRFSSENLKEPILIYYSIKFWFCQGKPDDFPCKGKRKSGLLSAKHLVGSKVFRKPLTNSRGLCYSVEVE
jgi:hypothetical protein